MYKVNYDELRLAPETKGAFTGQRRGMAQRKKNVPRQITGVLRNHSTAKVCNRRSYHQPKLWWTRDLEGQPRERSAGVLGGPVEEARRTCCLRLFEAHFERLSTS